MAITISEADNLLFLLNETFSSFKKKKQEIISYKKLKPMNI